MPHMIALQEFNYAAGALHLVPGDKFFASDDDARLLVGWGKAKEATPVERKVMTTADMPQEPKRRGRYKRSDMRADTE